MTSLHWSEDLASSKAQGKEESIILGSCWPNGLGRKEEDSIFLMFSQPFIALSRYKEDPALTPVWTQRKAGMRRNRTIPRDLQGQLLHHPRATPAPTNAGTLQALQCLCSPLSISWAFGSHSFYDGVKGNQQPRLPSSLEMLWNFQRTQLFPHIPVLICTDSALDALHCKWCMKWNLLARLMQRRRAL